MSCLLKENAWQNAYMYVINQPLLQDISCWFQTKMRQGANHANHINRLIYIREKLHPKRSFV